MTATAVVNFDSLFERRVGAPPLTVAVTSWNGLTGDVVGTLANIWTYGQTHPSNLLTNYFPMDSGNYRFTGSANSGALPATGFFESNAGGNPGGDSRVGTDYFRRYYRTALGAGGSVFDEFVCYDPLWNGAFTGTGAVQHTTQKIGFSDGSGPQDQPNVGLTMGAEVWEAVQGFFDGPLTYPTPGFNTGAREDVTWALYNGNAAVTETRGYLNGWGQFVALTQPNQNGKWTGYDIQIDPSYAPAGVAGDGAGLTVRYGRGSPAPDPPKGGIYATMTDGNFAHGWGWDFLVSPSSGSLTKIARFDWDVGAAFEAPVVGKSGIETKTFFGATQPGSTPPLSGPGEARFFWDDVNQAFQLSADGLAYGVNDAGILPIAVTFANGATATVMSGVGPNLPFVKPTIQRWLVFSDGAGGAFVVPSWA